LRQACQEQRLSPKGVHGVPCDGCVVSRDTDPRSLFDRLISACFAVLLGALALYVAVRLVEAVWSQLLVGAGVVSALAGGWLVWRWRAWW
jgi:hypothetical protein